MEQRSRVGRRREDSCGTHRTQPGKICFEIIQGPSFAKKLVKPYEDWIDMKYLQSR